MLQTLNVNIREVERRWVISSETQPCIRCWTTCHLWEHALQAEMFNRLLDGHFMLYTNNTTINNHCVSTINRQPNKLLYPSPSIS
jgi:hypothetical protein